MASEIETFSDEENSDVENYYSDSGELEDDSGSELENENKSNEPNESNINPKSKCFTIESPEYIKYKNEILGSPTYSDIDSKFFTYHIKGGKRTKVFCNKIKRYGLNLPINKKHYKNIETELLTEENPLFCSEFVVVEYTKYKTNDKRLLISLIDGHHRKCALDKIFEHHPKFEIDIRVCLYNSDYPDSPDTKKLFRKFNILKPFVVDFNIMEISSSIINELNSKFNNQRNKFILIKDTDAAVYKPSIKKSTINEAIQRRLELLKNSKHINANDIDIKIIILSFIKYNNILSNKTLEWFKTDTEFGVSTVSSIMIDKAKKSNCFIGLVKLESLINNCICENYN